MGAASAIVFGFAGSVDIGLPADRWANETDADGDVVRAGRALVARFAASGHVAGDPSRRSVTNLGIRDPDAEGLREGQANQLASFVT